MREIVVHVFVVEDGKHALEPAESCGAGECGGGWRCILSSFLDLPFLFSVLGCLMDLIRRKWSLGLGEDWFCTVRFL